MKRLRFCYSGFAVVSLFAALLTGRREFFLLLFMLVFVAAYALALNLWTIFSFTFVQELANQSSEKGGLTHLKIHIHNDKPFPFTLMKIEVETAVPSEKTALRFNLSPKDSISFNVPLNCAYRGEFAVGMTVINVTDIFGLFRIRYDLRALPYYRQRKLKIYPRILALGFLPSGARDSKLSGGVMARIGSSGGSFSGTRDYRAGDALKQIHWTASARARKLISKSYDLPSQPTALIAVDNSDNGLEGEQLLRYADLACECACAIARYCSGKGRMVKLVSAGDASFDPGSSGKHNFSDIYETLAVLPFNVKDSLYKKIQSETKKGADLYAIYILTRKQDAELSQFLAEFVRTGCDVKYLFLDTGDGAARCDQAQLGGASCVEISYGGDVAAILEGLY